MVVLSLSCMQCTASIVAEIVSILPLSIKRPRKSLVNVPYQVFVVNLV